MSSVWELVLEVDEGGEIVGYYADPADAKADKAFLEDLTRNRDSWLTFAITELTVLHTTMDGTLLALKARELEESYAEPGDWIPSEPTPEGETAPVVVAPGQEGMGL